MDVVPNAKAYVNFDLFLNVIESADGLRMDCDYNTDLFDASTVTHWLDCYQALLESIVADATQPLSSAACVPAAERALSVHERSCPISQSVQPTITITYDAEISELPA